MTKSISDTAIQNQKLASLVSQLKPSGIRKFFNLSASMGGVISLGIGEPDFVTPWRISEAAVYAIERGRTDRRVLRLQHILRWFERYLKT